MNHQLYNMRNEEDEICISFTERFPLITCASCGIKFALIYYHRDDYWEKRASVYYCPHCGKKWTSMD